MAWKLGRIAAYSTGCLIGCCFGCGVLSAQVPAAAGMVLRELASHAAIIFAGQVIEISHQEAEGFVDVRFRIDQALRGCPKSGAYVLREWAGLWTGHPERYAVGQRRLMLLTGRGVSGMSSPVGGMDGAIPLVATGVEPLANAAGVAPADLGTGAGSVGFSADLSADLRWIQARAERSLVAGPMTLPSHMALAGVPLLPREGEWNGAIFPLHAGAATASLASVTALLGPTNAAVSHARY